MQVFNAHAQVPKRPAISKATSQLASENDSSSDIEDPFAPADEDEGELEQNELVLDDDC